MPSSHLCVDYAYDQEIVITVTASGHYAEEWENFAHEQTAEPGIHSAVYV